MREILFRGKRIDNGEWIEGYYAAEPYVKSTYNYGYILENEKDLFAKKAYLVDSRTVGQYTGLTDKNGKKIFEGDVLNVHDQIPMFDGYDTDEIVYNGKVMYIKNQGMYVCEGNNDGNALCALNLDKCEVIGNIYDNPELLGGESDG